MTVGLSAPHPPYVCDKVTYDYYYNLLPDLDNEKYEESYHQAIKDFMSIRNMEKYDQGDIKKIRAAYYGLVEFLDGNIGKIIENIDRTLGLDNTIIIYASDHGDHLGERNMIWKGSFYDSSVKVPLIISYPRNYLKDMKYEEGVSLLDLSMTMISMAGAEELPEMDGVSLEDCLIRGGKPTVAREIISQIGTYPLGYVPSAMIRKGRYKLIAYHGYKDLALYDLKMDPEEMNNLSNKTEYAGLRELLYQALVAKWDSNMVEESCRRSRDQYNIMSQWSHKTKYPKKTNWKPVPNSNFLCK